MEEVANCLHFSHGLAYKIIHNKHAFPRVYARRVPKQLTILHKNMFGLLPTFGSLVMKLGSKWQSMECKHPQLPRKKNTHQKSIISWKTYAYSFLGLTRPSTGTLSGKGHNNKQCLLQCYDY
jgi:hypothetical protein